MHVFEVSRLQPLMVPRNLLQVGAEREGLAGVWTSIAATEFQCLLTCVRQEGSSIIEGSCEVTCLLAL